jgi:hypothetical protein
LNAELNPIFHLLALLGAHHILHVSRIRVKVLCLAACFFCISNCKHNCMNHKRKEEMSAKGWNYLLSAERNVCCFTVPLSSNLHGAILCEGLIVVQRGEKLAEYYGTPKDANHLSVYWIRKNVNDRNRRIKEPSFKAIFEQHFYCRVCYMFRRVQKPSSGTG